MAEWDTAYVNDLPDSAFACIDPGGTKEDGKTTPRGKRHYPHHNASGAVDLPHLRNALARVRQGATTSCGRDHLEAHAKAEGIGDRTMNKRIREERYLTVDDLEVREEARAEGGKAPVITGHPVLYNVWSEDLGGFRERISTGAAAKTLLESDIRVLFNHDPNYVLGRNKSGTAEFTDQGKGVRMRAFPPDTQTIRDLVIEPMRRGDLNQMSFAFRVAGPTWNSRDGGKPPVGTGEAWNDDYTEREIFQFQMYDASVVTFPGYTQTDAAVRSLPGMVDGLGIDWAALTACLTRSARGLPLLAADVDMLRASVALLQSHIPEPEPSEATTQDATEAVRSLAHFRTLLALEAASA